MGQDNEKSKYLPLSLWKLFQRMSNKVLECDTAGRQELLSYWLGLKLKYTYEN